MISITTDQLQRLAPKMLPNYRDAFAGADPVLAKYGINDSGLRLAHFMAQILHESGAFTITTESLNYRPERLLDVWPTRFKTLDDAQPFAHNPEALANNVYGGRMGNVDPGDGWKYIGRGLLQLTGRESYEKYGTQLGVDLAGTPDLAFSAEWCLPIAAAEWVASNCNAFADADDVRKVTKAINGGYVGLPERQAWLAKTKPLWITS